MHSDGDLRTEGNLDKRRIRIKRMKKLIIFVVLLLIILPMICCVILGTEVYRLQKQVNKLSATYGLKQTSQNSKDGEYAYAAVKTNIDTVNIPSIVPFTQENDTYAIDDSDKNTYFIKDRNHGGNTENQNASEEIDIDTTSPEDKGHPPTEAATVATDMDKNSNVDKITGNEIYAGKQIYLTFDDGPSEYTGQILDILAQYHIKATFFVIGKTDDKSKELYKRIVNEGHTLGMHSFSHQYSKIYNSVEDFDKDFTKLWKLLYDTTGYKPTIYRFPGGSDNYVNENGMDEFIKYLNDKSIVYFDWNVVNKDATSTEFTKRQLEDNVLDGVANKKRSIVLMHDTQTKKTTVDSLPDLIETLISGGAQILPLDNTVAPIQMIKADSVK